MKLLQVKILALQHSALKMEKLYNNKCAIDYLTSKAKINIF